jgi:hypothetical protein
MNTSDKVLSLYDKITENEWHTKKNKKQKKELMNTILQLMEEGISDAGILRMFSPDLSSAQLPAVPRNPPLDPEQLLRAAAVPVLIAIERNLPICQETFTFGANTFPVLLGAFWVNLLDHYKYVTDQLPIVQYDLKSILDLKQASMQKKVVGDQEFIYTWENVNQSLLDFLTLAAYPSDIPDYTAGYLGPLLGSYPTLNIDPPAGITDEVVSTEFIEHYIKMITQISTGAEDCYVRTTEYESPFSRDSSLWAYNVPTSTDPNNFMTKYADVRHDLPIPKSSEWLALTPFAATTSLVDSNVRVRFTAYSGLVHYADRVADNIFGRHAQICDPAFICLDQILDLFMRSLLLSDIDLFETKASALISAPPDSPLENLSRQELTTYIMGFLSKIYMPWNTRMAYSLPPGVSTMAGMSFLPNVNYSNILLFADLIERLEILGPMADFRNKDRNRASVKKIPVLFFYDPVCVNYGGNSLAGFADMFVDSGINYDLKPSVDDPFIPQAGPILCYTRGTFVQNLWHTVEGSIAQYGNVRLMSSFEEFFEEVCDYDKYTILFKEDVPPITTDKLNRHFLVYERGNMSSGERNVLRLTIGQVLVLGSETLTFQEKLERVRTAQTFFQFKGSEYVDSTIDPSIESPNTLADINAQSVQYERRFKYQEITTDANANLIVTLMRGKGGNFFATLRKGVGSVAKVLAPIAGATLAATGNPALGGVVGAMGGLFDRHKSKTNKKHLRVFEGCSDFRIIHIDSSKRKMRKATKAEGLPSKNTCSCDETAKVKREDYRDSRDKLSYFREDGDSPA